MSHDGHLEFKRGIRDSIQDVVGRGSRGKIGAFYYLEEAEKEAKYLLFFVRSYMYDSIAQVFASCFIRFFICFIRQKSKELIHVFPS